MRLRADRPAPVRHPGLDRRHVDPAQALPLAHRPLDRPDLPLPEAPGARPLALPRHAHDLRPGAEEALATRIGDGEARRARLGHFEGWDGRAGRARERLSRPARESRTTFAAGAWRARGLARGYSRC